MSCDMPSSHKNCMKCEARKHLSMLHTSCRASATKEPKNALSHMHGTSVHVCMNEILLPSFTVHLRCYVCHISAVRVTCSTHKSHASLKFIVYVKNFCRAHTYILCVKPIRACFMSGYKGLHVVKLQVHAMYRPAQISQASCPHTMKPGSIFIYGNWDIMQG